MGTATDENRQTNLFPAAIVFSDMHKPLTPEQRLEVLRNLDSERKWSSLDDRRLCLVCDRIITGRHIAIRRDQHGQDVLRCPTKGCPAFVSHWLYVGRNPEEMSDGLQSRSAV